MSKLHSMPMFWADFFADTEHLSDEAAHAYCFLIGHAWLRGAKLPDDDRALCRMARISFKKWLAIKDEVLSLWVFDEGNGGGWSQKRLTKEWLFVSRKAEDYRKNGSLGGTRSAAKRAVKSTHTPQASLNHPTPTPTLLEDKVETSVSPLPSNYRDADASLVNGAVDGGPVEIKKSKKDTEALRGFGEQWNALAAAFKFPSIDEIKSGSTRERHALARLREMGSDGVPALMTRIRGSPYLRGEVNGFRVTFDWIVNPTNYQKIMEGNYEDRKIPNRRR